MHSRIFQISTQPIDQADYISESDCYDALNVADYVSECTDRADDIDWLKSCFDGFDISSDSNGEYLIVTNKKKFFKKAYDQFVGKIQELKNCNLEEFIGSISLDMYILNNAYNDTHGFYIYYEYGLYSLDSFIRNCEENTKYYLGGTLDYHY